MKLRMVAVLLSSAVFLPTIVVADVMRGQHMLSAQLGTVAPLSEIEFDEMGGGKADAGDGGSAMGFQYLYNVTDRFAVGGDFNLTSTGESDSTALIPFGESNLSYKSALTLAIGRFNFTSQGRVIPYVMGGFGIHKTNLKIEMGPVPGIVWADTGTSEKRTLVDSDDAGIAIALGVGSDFYITEQFFLGLEGRYQYLSEGSYETTPLTMNTTGVSNVEGSFAQFHIFGRVGFKFGGSSTSAAVVPQEVSAPSRRTYDSDNAM